MSLKQLIDTFSESGSHQPPDTMNYDDIFTGTADAPIPTTSEAGNFLPGLAQVQNEVDAYFKEVFTGPLF